MNPNRFNNTPRDRSPPRYENRRPSGNTYPSGGSSYRGSGDSFQPSSERDPPLGPKAQRPDTFGPRYPFSPGGRGRGGGASAFSNRSSGTWESRDRDRDRDSRAPQSYRSRDEDRPDWNRRERELIPGDRGAPVARDSRPYGARDRSASPPRTRRDSRESIPPLTSRPSDTGSYYGASARGGLGRGRGRGDVDRSRGRNSFGGERDRDLFSNRSRSREGWRDREFDRPRPSVPDTIRPDRYERRDVERGREQDPRRDYDSWQRDHSPSRASIGAPAGRGTSPTTSSKMDYEIGRRPSAVITPGSLGRDRREHDQADYFGGRPEAPRRDGSIASYQSQPAQTPAAGVGLDYGPPPSAPTTSTNVAERPAQGKPISVRNEAPTAANTSFQPPSAPKADRTAPSNVLAQTSKPATQPDSTGRMDFVSRPRAPAGPSSVSGVTDSVPKPLDTRTETKPSMPHTPDKSMPANVPLGPRASLGVGFKPRQPSSEPATAAAPSSKGVTSDYRSMGIPTGPRSEQPPWSTAGLSNRTTWVSPEYSRSKPSIMNPLGRDRPSFAPPAGPRSQSILPPHNEKPRIFSMHSSKGAGAPSAPPGGFGQKPNLSPAHQLALSAGINISEDVDMSSRASSEDEDEFDEDDFAADEEKHRQERMMLESRKPPPLLQDAPIRNLLIRIQFLNMIMHEVVPKSLVPVDLSDGKVKAPEPPSIGLPSPEEMSEHEERPELKHPQPRGRPLSQPAINPIPTPPIEDLPFLSRQSPKRIAFHESDDEVEHEAITTLIRQEFESAAFDWQDELQDLHTEYRQRFPLWRQEIVMQDHQHRELQPSPAPASPAPSVAPSVTPSLGHERTRGARNTTEADLQAAILMSQQSLKEEEERREREAASNKAPNYDTEAVVPPMMKPSDVELNFFEDTNKLIPTDLAIEVFAYVPPEDDFTEEEQLAFIRAYCEFPKKWGKISEALPGRTYKDCIMHYYLTKNEAKYKLIWRNSQPKRKRGRAATKPRSTALMSELVYENEADGTVAVTDTGRPRRAAAPTFGDTPGDSDIATPVPQSKRLAVTKESNGEPVTAKSGRGRKAGGPAKPRRTKAQMQADQQAAMLLPGVADGSPQKAPAGSRERARTLLRAENGVPKNDFAASPDMHRVTEVDMGQYHIVDPDRLQPSATSTANNQPTSYWSVPEQQKFPQLIAYFGKDFGSIADFMKTKTVTMIKNHYNRQISDGKSDLEEVARAADRRRAAGEQMGQPPSPAAQTKRRYEATPSTASITRPAGSQADQGIPELDQPPLKTKTGYTEDFPSNAVQRGNSGVDLIAKHAPARDILREAQPVAPGQAKIEELQRPQMFGQKPAAGPRPGFFKEEPVGYGLPHHSLRDQSPHQHPLRPGESRIGDLSLPQSLLGHPREHLGGPHGGMQPPSSQPSSTDRFGIPVQQSQHGRSGSLGMIGHHPNLQEQRDPTSFRRLQSNPRQSPYSLAPSQPPISMPAQSSILSRSETSSTGQVTTEPPKPAPAKRSNLMNLLNDDPPDQPQKRTSLESQNRPSLLSPQPVPVTSQSLSFEAARAQARQEDILGLHQNMRGPLGQPPSSRLGNLSLRDPQPGFQPDQNSERWLDRFDPRPQSGPTEQRGLHSSPRPGAYSVVPPSNSSQGARMEAQRSMESAHPDHRRMLTQMNHPGLNPSPPPQQAPQSIPPYRSLSGSSHHGRFNSTGFPQNQPFSQQSPHMHPVQQPPGPPSHPTSAGSTPVSSLHHRGQPSIDYGPQRLTIQQHLAQQQQAHHREREHDEAIRRQIDHQREMEAQQQRMRMPERERDHLGRHRDILGLGSMRNQEPQSQNPTSHHHQPQHHSHNHQQHQQHQQIMAGIPGARHLGFGAPQQQHEPVTRTYTPPGMPFGGASSMLGHAQHGQHQHGHHPHQQHQQGPGPGQHPGQGQQQQQGGPGQGSQQHGFGHGHSHGHFRALSQGQGDGREERR